MEPDVRERFERLEGIVVSLVELARSHEARLDRVADLFSSHEERLDRVVELARSHEERMNRLALTQEETHEELTSLIRMMDEWIRRNPSNGGASSH